MYEAQTGKNAEPDPRSRTEYDAVCSRCRSSEYGEERTDGVKIGAEVLLESEEWKEHLKGKNVALVTNQVCVEKNMDHMAGQAGRRPGHQPGVSVRR